MEIELHRLDGIRQRCKEPYPGATFVEVGHAVHCDACGEPLCVRCQRATQRHDRVEGDARSVCCERPEGRLVVTFQTIFGLEEDARVLNGRCRVY